MKNLMHLINYLMELDIYSKKYTIGNSTDLLDLRDMKLLSIKGAEYIVFEYQGKVIKIRKEKGLYKNMFDEENLKSLRKYKTKRILLPENLVYGDDKCAGYSMVKVNGKSSLSDYISMRHFIDEASKIYEDVILLTNNIVLIDDLHYFNSIYNGELFCIDCGEFRDFNAVYISEEYLSDLMLTSRYQEYYFKDLTIGYQKVVKSRVASCNIKSFNELLSELICYNSSRRKNKIVCNNVYHVIGLKADHLHTDNFLDVLDKDCSGSDITLKEYGKYLIRHSNFK